MKRRGEVLEEILKKTDDGKNKFVSHDEFKEELGDLLFALCCIANSTDTDLEEELDKVLNKYGNRINMSGSPDSKR